MLSENILMHGSTMNGSQLMPADANKSIALYRNISLFDCSLLYSEEIFVVPIIGLLSLVMPWAVYLWCVQTYPNQQGPNRFRRIRAFFNAPDVLLLSIWSILLRLALDDWWTRSICISVLVHRLLRSKSSCCWESAFIMICLLINR